MIGRRFAFDPIVWGASHSSIPFWTPAVQFHIAEKVEGTFKKTLESNFLFRDFSSGENGGYRSWHYILDGATLLACLLCVISRYRGVSKVE